MAQSTSTQTTSNQAAVSKKDGDESKQPPAQGAAQGKTETSAKTDSASLPPEAPATQDELNRVRELILGA